MVSGDHVLAMDWHFSERPIHEWCVCRHRQHWQRHEGGQPHNVQDVYKRQFGNFSGYWMVQTLEKALDVYENNADAWKQLQHNAMTRDFSWDTASLAYVDLYKQLV